LTKVPFSEEQEFYFCNAIISVVTKLSLATRELPLHNFFRLMGNQNQIRFLSCTGSNHAGCAPHQEVMTPLRRQGKSRNQKLTSSTFVSSDNWPAGLRN
jgi:hypothetical protein